jgi:hypothetical protein
MILEDKFFVEDLHAQSVQIFHQEKTFQDLCRKYPSLGDFFRERGSAGLQRVPGEAVGRWW